MRLAIILVILILFVVAVSIVGAATHAHLRNKYYMQTRSADLDDLLGGSRVDRLHQARDKFQEASETLLERGDMEGYEFMQLLKTQVDEELRTR